MNYLLMIAGIVVIIIGFLLMTGGAPDNPAIFNPDEKYSFRRITLGPIVILIGLAIEFLSILVKARE
ncbi:MAG: hypothetical protein KatS3mg031_0625 [Chitinophagales bacterium]|nr:MAG: hypothetical protein KatS3mg031_0625 [Chitinophagales bacterium]